MERCTMAANEVLLDVMRQFIAYEEGLLECDHYAQFLRIRIEQDALRAKPEYSCKVGSDARFFCKNRYRDIIPYDTNRVRLAPCKSEEETTENDDEGYINASFITVPPAATTYIAAQAPLSTTLTEWFSMIRENNVAVVVMLCKLVELGKAKCERYWPEEVGGECEFGGVVVSLLEETQHEEYCSRRLRLRWPADDHETEVQQLHFSEWPDHGCPHSEHHVLSMIELFDTLHRKQPDKPVLVHCSAGCGRTGTIIAANVIRELINSQAVTKELNLYDLVMELRTQRVSMVQTPDQYQFLHKLVRHFCSEKLVEFREGVDEQSGECALKEGSCESSSSQVDSEPTSSEGVSRNASDDVCTQIVSIPDYPEEPSLKPLGPEPMPVSWSEGSAVTS